MLISATDTPIEESAADACGPRACGASKPVEDELKAVRDRREVIDFGKVRRASGHQPDSSRESVSARARLLAQLRAERLQLGGGAAARALRQRVKLPQVPHAVGSEQQQRRHGSASLNAILGSDVIAAPTASATGRAAALPLLLPLRCAAPARGVASALLSLGATAGGSAC